VEEGSAVGVEEGSAVGTTDSKFEGVIVEGTDDDGPTVDGTDDDGVTVDGTDDDGLTVDGGQPMTVTGVSPGGVTRNIGGGVQ
jgi:hypothetical protein